VYPAWLQQVVAEQSSPASEHDGLGAGAGGLGAGVGGGLGLGDGVGAVNELHESPVATGQDEKQEGIATSSPLSRVTVKDALPLLPSVFADQVAPLTRVIWKVLLPTASSALATA